MGKEAGRKRVRGDINIIYIYITICELAWLTRSCSSLILSSCRRIGYRFYRVRRWTSNSGVFLDLVRLSNSLHMDSQGFAFFVVHISLRVNPLLTNDFACEVCSFACSAVFSFHRLQQWFTLAQSDPFRCSSKLIWHSAMHVLKDVSGCT